MASIGRNVRFFELEIDVVLATFERAGWGAWPGPAGVGFDFDY